jgi:hypothetical protein
MLALLAVIAGAAMGFSCLDPEGAKILGVTIMCDKPGIYKFAVVLIAAIIANQGVFLISPQTQGVKYFK